MDESRTRLALAYAPGRMRDAFSAIIQLDSALGRSVAAISDPFYGQVRLAWWRDQIAALGTGVAVNDPVLISLERKIDGIRPLALALVNAWETLFDTWPMTIGSAENHARQRGEALFSMAAELAGITPGEDIMSAGRLWALADLAFHCSDAEVAGQLLALARADLGSAKKIPHSLLTFRILARFAERDVQRGLAHAAKPGSPRDIATAFAVFLGAD